ncbi:MAG: DUF4862 family protein [Gammaproteobacteria bacterium]|nr:DUF4862 family protein [Gammaproteobacteria bacterium]
MSAHYFISAYATSPSSDKWCPEDESRYFHGLANKPEVVGIEHPFLPQSDKYPLPWLLENIPENWSLIITALPEFMNLLKGNPYFGLASVVEKDRMAAVKIMEDISDYIRKLNRGFGRKIVKAVHFHSLPRNVVNEMRGSKQALKQSLREIKDFNWDGAELNLEHCDAYIPNQIADKGFLLLEDEIEVISTVGGYGIVLNWARSAIEGRSVKKPLSHIEMVKNAGLFNGFFFSGCTDDVNSNYGYWRDTHMPPRNFINGDYLQSDGLLGIDEVKQTMQELNNYDEDIYLGIKVSDLAADDNIDKKIGLNTETIDALNYFIL